MHISNFLLAFFAFLVTTSFSIKLTGAAAAAQEPDTRHFDGYQVIRTAHVNTTTQFDLLKSLAVSGDYDFWVNPALGGHADILLAANQLNQITTKFKSVGLEFQTKIPDVEKLIAETRSLNEAALRGGGGGGGDGGGHHGHGGHGQMNWLAYQRWSVIEPWILSFEREYPHLTETRVIGRTYEGRAIYMIKVSTDNHPDPERNGGHGARPKKAILIDANIHAREWIAGAVGSWILNELVTNVEKYWAVLEQVDFYIIPYINVDGYEYSHTADRLWRKTRKPNPGSACVGVDPNRNFGFHYGGESTSTDPCSEIYIGTHAFSESETIALRDALINLQKHQSVGAYITIHSYGQTWLLSWGFTQDVYPSDYPQLLDWGRSSVARIKAVNGVTYQTGQGADMLYGVGGASDDYAKSKGVKYCTTAELRDTGDYGFLLPPNQILDTAKEVLAGVLNTAEYVIALH